MKGVTLNYINSKAVNFETVKDFILDNVFNNNDEDEYEYYITTEHMQFKKDQKDKSITTKYIEKKYAFSYDKCAIIKNPNNKNIIDTLPFGHNKLPKD